MEISDDARTLAQTNGNVHRPASFSMNADGRSLSGNPGSRYTLRRHVTADRRSPQKEPRLMPALQKLDDGQSEVFLLRNGTTTIGRGSGSHVVISSLLVSKTHARVTCEESVCSVVDLSSNGTRVNGRRLTQQHRLKHGDQIEVGPIVLIFLEGDNPEDWSGTTASSHHQTVLPATAEDPDASMRRQPVKPGESVVLSVTGSSETLSHRKILSSIGLLGLPIATLTANDSVQKLSHVLRFSELLSTSGVPADLPAIFETLHLLFPSARQIVFAGKVGESAACRILGTSCLDGLESVMICHPLIRKSLTDCEAVLVTDQWKDGATDTPKLSELNRRSLMCVPIRSGEGLCGGAIQMTAAFPGTPFDQSDLERLSILAQVLAIVMPRLAESANGFLESPTDVGRTEAS